MKKIFHAVSLIIISVVLCGIMGFVVTAFNVYMSEKFENKTEDVDEVGDVMFSHGKLAVIEDEVIASVIVTTRKGSELVIKNFGKVVQTDAGGRYYGNGVPERISQNITTDRSVRVCDGDWEYDCQVSTIKDSYRLDDIIFSNTYMVQIPSGITIRKYGKSFTFDDIVLTTGEVENSMTEVEGGKYLHVASLWLNYGGYHENVACVNEIYKY